MKALHNFATSLVLLAALAVLPGTLISFRMMLNQMCDTIPHHASTLRQADFWLKAFGS